jgi:hypothetical protein
MLEAVIFTVDLFSSLYVATSMQTATPARAVVTIVLINVIQSATSLYRLHRRSAAVLTTLRKADAVGGDTSVVRIACELCRSAKLFVRQTCSSIRKRSALLHSLS